MSSRDFHKLSLKSNHFKRMIRNVHLPTVNFQGIYDILQLYITYPAGNGEIGAKMLVEER